MFIVKYDNYDSKCMFIVKYDNYDNKCCMVEVWGISNGGKWKLQQRCGKANGNCSADVASSIKHMWYPYRK
jgi:hypothetical protein